MVDPFDTLAFNVKYPDRIAKEKVFKESMFQAVMNTLQELGVNIPDDIIWSHRDQDVLEEAVRISTEQGVTQKEFTERYNKLIEPTAMSMIEENRKIKLDSMLEGLEVSSVWSNVNVFYEHNPFFYDKTQLFWFWKKQEFKWEIVDETDLMNSLEEVLKFKGETSRANIKARYLECFKRIGRKNIPKEPPKHWIQFKNRIFDLKTRETSNATPEWFFCNPIPHEIGKSSDTLVMDALFKSWVGEDNVRTLYEILAYCCYSDYPIHTIFCLIGSGRNGKSRFLDLIRKFIGITNGTSTELDSLLDSRFESAKLYKKLYCVVGETNFGIMQKTSLLKKLSGQDMVGGEYKGKQPFDFQNYSKIIIASNSLPTSMDTSDGFYRRWMIIDFPNEFSEGRDILETIPKEEYCNLSSKIINIIPTLIDFGKFSNQGTIEQRKKMYIMSSNPLPYFIDNFCDKGIDFNIQSQELYRHYVQYLIKHKKRKVSRTEFREALSLEGFEALKTSKHIDGIVTNGYFIEALRLKLNFNEIFEKSDKSDKSDVLSNYFPSIEKLSEKYSTNVTNVTKNQQNINLFINSPKIFQPCQLCELNPVTGNYLLDNGKIICELCIEAGHLKMNDDSYVTGK